MREKRQELLELIECLETKVEEVMGETKNEYDLKTAYVHFMMCIDYLGDVMIENIQEHNRNEGRDGWDLEAFLERITIDTVTLG